jgi:uncharacterized protein YuzE
MKDWTYSKDYATNAEYIAFSNRVGRGVVAKTKVLREGLLLDLNEKGEVVGIEILAGITTK